MAPLFGVGLDEGSLQPPWRSSSEKTTEKKKTVQIFRSQLRSQRIFTLSGTSGGRSCTHQGNHLSPPRTRLQTHPSRYISVLCRDQCNRLIRPLPSCLGFVLSLIFFRLPITLQVRTSPENHTKFMSHPLLYPTRSPTYLPPRSPS
jgi:hypothetical protein